MLDHKNAVTQIVWPYDGADNLTLYSCGAINGTSKRGEIFQWNLHTFKRSRQYLGHKAIVNSIDANDQLLCSASDDGTVKVWDHRSKYAEKSFEIGP